MCSGSVAGSYPRLIDFMYHSTLGLRVIKRKKKGHLPPTARPAAHFGVYGLGFPWSERESARTREKVRVRVKVKVRVSVRV